MITGKVKWFDANKGFGFIRPNDGSTDVFVHISALQSAGIATLDDGQSVKFELVAGRNGKSAAGNLQLAD